MTTRAGTSYSPAQTKSSVAMDQNIGNMIKALNDQVALLNKSLTEQLAQTNQNVAQTNQNLNDQLAHITARLDQLEARTPEENHGVQSEPNPEPEFETPLNPRRVQPQGLFQEPNPDRFNEPNPRRVYQNPAYDQNPRRLTPIQLDQDDRAMRSVKLEAPTFDGILDPKIYIDWEGEMDQYFDWYDMSEERKCKFAKLKLVRQARLY